jgi:DNA-binding transcriptional MocR family regulator
VQVPEHYRLAGSNARELVASVEAGIAGGTLSPGQRLPTVRALAASLGLSPATVASAYRDLRSRGLVVGEGRRGTRVRDRPPLRFPSPLPPPPGARDLASGNPDPSLLPDLAAAAHQAAAQQAAAYEAAAPEGGAKRGSARPASLAHPHQTRLPPGLYGALALLPELADLARERLAADGIDPAHLAVVSGALDGVERALATWLRPGDGVVVEDPGYAYIFDLLATMGLRSVPAGMDEEGLLPAALARALAGGARAMIATPRAQNPTGAAWTATRISQLAEVLARFPDTLVIEDDHAGPVAGSAALTLGARARWVTVRSVSKSLGPDLRLALMAGDQATVDRVTGRQALGPGWVSHHLQAMVATLWSDPSTKALLTRAEAAYTERRRALVAALGRHGIASMGRSGLNVWVPVPAEHPVVAGLLERGWAVSPGERFRLGSGPGVRITVASLQPAEADQLAADLSACLLTTPARSA